jgi:hypothetical protein
MQLDHGQAVIRVSCGGWIELRDPTLEASFSFAPLGATVTVYLQTGEPAVATSVPLSALDDEGKGRGVWTLDARDVPGFIPPGAGRSAQSGKRNSQWRSNRR